MDAKDIVIIIAVAFLATSAATFGGIDANHADQQRAHYCQMVETWNNNQHVPPEQRPGWPPYNGEAMCEN